MNQLNENEVQVTVLRVDNTCPDVDSCPAFTTVNTDQEWGYVIVKEVTDPAILAAHAKHIGPGERLGRVPRHLAPEVFGS
jgi:hypothetical protein